MSADALEERSVAKVILLSFVTFGLYVPYWFHQVNKQLKSHLDADFDPTIRLVGFFVPVVNLVMMWKQSQLVERFDSDRGAGLTFLAWVFFFPLAQALIQGSINEQA
jgi:hypothetical protein